MNMNRIQLQFHKIFIEQIYIKITESDKIKKNNPQPDFKIRLIFFALNKQFIRTDISWTFFFLILFSTLSEIN